MMSSTSCGRSGSNTVDDVRRDLLRLELGVELGRRAQLRDDLVDRDAAHLGRARGHDALPADAAERDARHLLQLPRDHRCDLAQARDLEAVELDGAEEHPEAGPVDQPADDAGEERDRDEREPVDAVRSGEVAAGPVPNESSTESTPAPLSADRAAP